MPPMGPPRGGRGGRMMRPSGGGGRGGGFMRGNKYVVVQIILGNI